MALYFRKPRPSHNFSIERLFEAVISELPELGIQAVMETCPYYSNGRTNRLRLMLWARGRQTEVNHVTGDVNFLGLLMERRRTILTIHDSASLRRLKGFRRWLYAWLWIRLPVWHAARVTTISELARQEILGVSPWAAGKIDVIPNCVPDGFMWDERPFNNSRPRVLHVGTAVNKNLQRVIEALQGVPCHLVVVGPLHAADKAQLLNSGLQYENVEALDDASMAEEYRRCDIVMFPSLYEGFGLPILEGQATGRAVITSRRQPMQSVAGEGACLVEPESVAEIRAAVIRLCTDDAYRQTVVEQGLRNVANYMPSSIAARYAALYREVADAAR